MRSISIMVKPASGNCNMHCDYCFYYDEMQNREQTSYGMMSRDTMKQVIRRTLMHTEQYYSLAFQGGEPTLCGIDFFKDVLSFIRLYNVNNAEIHLALQTNGYAINEEWAKFFADNHFLIGLSVDGLPELHRAFRHGNDGGDSYDHITRTAELFDQYGVEYNILTVVHRETTKHAKEIYETYKQRGWKWLQFINCLDPLGEEPGSRPYSLRPEDYAVFLKDLFACWYRDFKKGEQPYIRMFDNYIGAYLGYMPEACDQRGECGVSYVVEADGGVYPCDFYVLDDYLLGNFRRDIPDAIDRKRKEICFVERSRKIPEECRKCKYGALCRNGCYRTREVQKDGKNYFCSAYKEFFDAYWPQIREIAEITAKQMKQK